MKQRADRFDATARAFDPEHADMGWTIAEPEPFWRAPTIRQRLWGLLTGRKPEWTAVAADPNPSERRFGRG